MKTNTLKFESFLRDFGTEQQCIDYLRKLRWNGGFICSKCQYTMAWQLSEIKYKCQNCGYQSTLSSGTLLHGTHLPLTLWFKAIWYMVNLSYGTNVAQFQRSLNLGSNRTAIAMINKIRKAMAICDNQKLCGDVFVDEIPILAKGSFSDNYALIAIEVNTKNGYQIRMKNVGYSSSETDVIEFISANIRKGSIIHTAGFYGLKKLPKGYVLKIEKRKSGSNNPPLVYDVLCELRGRELLGKRQCSCSSTNTDEYLSECCYKYNRLGVETADMLEEILLSLILRH